MSTPRPCVIYSVVGTKFETDCESMSISDVIKEASSDDDEGEVIFPTGTKESTDENIKKMIEYCEHYKTEPMTEIDTPLVSTDFKDLVQEYYVNFWGEMTYDEICAFLNLANYMAIKPLVRFCCAKIASAIKGKTPEEIRKLFNVKEEPTEEQLAEIEKKNEWVQDM